MYDTDRFLLNWILPLNVEIEKRKKYLFCIAVNARFDLLPKVKNTKTCIWQLPEKWSSIDV